MFLETNVLKVFGKLCNHIDKDLWNKKSEEAIRIIKRKHSYFNQALYLMYFLRCITAYFELEASSRPVMSAFFAEALRKVLTANYDRGDKSSDSIDHFAKSLGIQTFEVLKKSEAVQVEDCARPDRNRRIPR